MLRRNKVLLTLTLVAVALVAIRAALPYAVKDYVNRTLSEMEAYDGAVADIDLALWRGAYRIDGIEIVKRGAEENVPFFSSERIDLSVQWRSLLKGSLVSEVAFIRPVLNLVQKKSAETSQTGKEEDWQTQLEELFPFTFNTVEVRDGTVTFRAPGIQTEDAIKAQRVEATITNLTNVEDANEETFATFDMNAMVLDDAPAKVSGSLDPLAKQPTFDVNLEIKQVALPKVNPWLQQYIKADAESGDFELFLEIAAAEGKFEGYAKPILRNVDITSTAEKEDNPLRKLWEGIVEFAANVLENKQEEQVAARAPFTGTIENPEASVWPTIVSVLRNAFVSAFARSLEGSISLRDVKENLGQFTDEEDREAKSPERDDDREKVASRNRTESQANAKEGATNARPRDVGPRSSPR